MRLCVVIQLCVIIFERLSPIFIEHESSYHTDG